MFTRTAYPRLNRAVAVTLATVGLTSGLVVVSGVNSESPASAQSAQCQSVTTLTNGGFETPVIPATSYRQLPASSVDGWSTTDPGGIEIWSTGFNGVTAPVGNQFAELNATVAGTLYQDVVTMPGQSLQWSLLHRARVGTDVMDVLIGSPSGTLASQGNLSDDTSAWGRHTGVYVVPAGQTLTRFGFRAVSAGSGDVSVGNFLDDISFGTGPCVVSTAGVTNVTNPGGAVRVGDVLEYTVSAENQGGSGALLSSLSDVLPAGIVFQPGSLRIATGPSTGTKSDAPADDQAEYDAVSRTITARLGDGANAIQSGSLAAQQETSLVFRAVVSSSAALGSIANAATITFTDGLTGQVKTSEAPAVVTPVAAASDLAVSQVTNVPTPVAGGSTHPQWTVTVANNGPQANTGIIASVTVPSQLINPSVTLADGTACAITAGVASCPIAALAVGASTTISVTGALDPALASGTTLTNTVSVSGAIYDPIAADNTSSATAVTSSTGDLWVTNSAVRTIVSQGSIAAFDVVVGNEGPSTASNVVVKLSVPAGMTVTATDGTFDPTTGFWTVPALASRTAQRATISGPAATLGQLTTLAFIDSSSIVDSNPGNETAAAYLSVQRIAVLAPVRPTAPVADPIAPSTNVAAVAVTASAATLASTGAANVQNNVFLALLLLVAGIALFAIRAVVRRTRRQ